MEFNKVIQQRRAVREYTAQLIERATIERLIRNAILAPSAENHQPWEFAVLLDPQRIDACAARAKHWLLEHPAELALDPALQSMLKNPQFSIFYHAPALVIVLAKSPDTQAQQDCCLAAENLLLAARDGDLGTCWISLARPWLELPETRAELGIPKSLCVVAPIVLGHPEKWPESHVRDPPSIHWLH